ncbi:MAG: hypothetical protein Q7U91_16330 [Sideroxyarcus sp.]|nr:hypothetical protein [Sideroxyarcus sp.]
MKILIPYYSRSGHTERLALRLGAELGARGHEIVLEKIEAVRERNKWLLVPPLLPLLPWLPLYLLHAPFRRRWLSRYRQQEQDIKPLTHPDVSGFDLILLGGPKWLYIAYPVARYLNTVSGLDGRKIGAFATFCGPPLKVFELEMLFSPLQDCIRAKGAELFATLAISSSHHPFFWFGELEALFRWISKLAFKRPLSEFALDSEWGQGEVRRFCESVEGVAVEACGEVWARD